MGAGGAVLAWLAIRVVCCYRGVSKKTQILFWKNF
jgi:hypothetical protein